MPANKKLGPLYAAKAEMRRAMIHQAGAADSSEVNLWAAVIEQAVHDAHLSRSRGNGAEAFIIGSARRFFKTSRLDQLCLKIDIEPDWVRRMASDIEAKARELRGDEYEGSLVLKNGKNRAKAAAREQQRVHHHDIRKRQGRLF